MNSETFLNVDNGDLQPAGGIGYVGVVNGGAALEVPGFLATRAELVELARYWESTFLQRAYFVFTTAQTGSTDLRLVPFAERRVARLIKFVGPDAVQAVREVREEFARSLGSRAWKSFCAYLGPHHRHGITADEPSRPTRHKSRTTRPCGLQGKFTAE
jgi:hypothetical protein